MARRLIVVIATLAALAGAPSAASAAPPNQLAGATVSPASGTAATTFTLSVAYRTDNGAAATAVAATVGGRMVPLTLVAGTPTSGTWRGSVGSLPAGSWPVTFAAVTEKGNQPSLVGPILAIDPPMATPPPPTPAPTPPRPQPTSSVDATDPGPGSGPSLAPGATAVPSTASAPSEPVPAGGGASPPPPPAAPASPASARQGGESGSTPGAPAEAGGAASQGEAPASPTRSPTGAGRELSQPAELNPWLAPLAVASAAGAALIGVYLFLGRRRADDESVIPHAAMAPVPGPQASDEATELLTRRTLRRARVRLPEDPIVAALGIDDDPGEVSPQATKPSAASGTRRAARRD